MRDIGTETLRAAFEQGLALGAFSTYTQETTQAICMAAADAGLPVILQAGSSAFKHSAMAELAAQALQAADRAPVPVGVHLDHSRDLSEIRACLAAGYTSVMVDGSHLPFDENVALTSAAVGEASRYGAWVEGELGAVPGEEDQSLPTETAELTDPARVEEFVARTGVDALAVAVGNVHGTHAEPAPLDLDLLSRLHACASVPLVLHGASGLPTHELSAARARGVAKVNVNTELRAAFLGAIANELPTALRSADLAAALNAAREAVRVVVHRKILALGVAGSTHETDNYVLDQRKTNA